MLGTTAVKTQAGESHEKSEQIKSEEKTNVKVDGKDIEVKSLATFTITSVPEKGDLIILDEQTATGLTNVYRVLKVDGAKALVMSMWDVAGSYKKYNTSSLTTNFTKPGGDTINGQQYAGSNLDTYLNGTFYETLSPDIKNAIVPQSIVQKAYGRTTIQPGSGTEGVDYWKGTYEFDATPRTYYITNPGYSASMEGTRKVYALEVEDVINYLGTSNINPQAVNEMFFNQETSVSNYCWLRSADTVNDTCAWYVGGYDGDLNYDSNGSSYAVRAAFVIDLSKCKWTTN